MHQDARTDVRRHVAFNALVLRAPFSGVEMAVAGQAAALAQTAAAAWRATVLWPRALRGAAAPSAVAPHRIVRCGPWCGARILRILWEQCVLSAKVRALGADLLHAPAYLAPLAHAGPVVLTVYDLHALDQPARCRRLNRWNYGLLLPRSIRRAARIVVPSEHTAAAVGRRFPAVRDRIRVVPLGIHARFRPASADDPARRWGATLPQRYWLCVGNIEPRKNLPVAIAALARLRQREAPTLALLIAGHATIGDPAIGAAIARHGLRGAVRFLGYVADEALPVLFAGAEAFVFAAADEGFGLPPLEAMACGCPVLCADAAALRQTAGGAARHFDHRDPESLADAARTLLGDGAARAACIARGLEHAARFRWPHLLPRLLAVYDEACTAGVAPR